MTNSHDIDAMVRGAQRACEQAAIRLVHDPKNTEALEALKVAIADHAAFRLALDVSRSVGTQSTFGRV